MADLYEVVGTLHGRVDQAVFIERHRVLPVLLHQPAGLHIAGVLVEAVDHGGVLGQMPHGVRAGLLGIGHIDDQLLLLDDIPGQGDDVLEALQGLLDGVHPGQIHGFLHLAVGELEFVVRLGDAVHKEPVELAVAQRAHHTADIFLI